ncbi:MAG: cation:proton antiporter [Rickettsiales bacterium]|jgi:Kef-type K+ transport system membrane component KefB/voltage-gated potassium channel Kch|nr:cation:proton antiporter [Rickettsiales bacterium]
MNLSVLYFLGLALGLSYLARRIKLNPMLAFFAAGIIAGPGALGLFGGAGNSGLDYMSELGMMFLWFALGLELNFKRLWSMRRHIFGLGAAEVLAVAAALFPVLYFITPWPLSPAIMIALILTMSSSSANLQSLADRNELSARLGRQTFSILLFQGLLAVPLLAMMPVFAGKVPNFGAEIIDVSVMTLMLSIGVIILARVVMNPFMKIVARIKSPVAFLLAVLLTIAACGAGFAALGLPVGIGAFVAGMLFSESLYQYQVRADIAPYQTLFGAMFFITLGMGLDVELMGEHWMLILVGAAALVALKFAIIYIVAGMRGVRARAALVIALILAQGGEFGLLVLQTLRAAKFDSIPNAHAEILIAVIMLSMIVSGAALLLYDWLSGRGSLYSAAKAKKYNLEMPARPAVIICGFGRVGVTIAKMLVAEKVPYLAIDMNIDRVLSGRERGFAVYYGDTTRSDVLAGFGLRPRGAKALIIALDNAAVAKKTVRAAIRAAKNVRIFARARNLDESKTLLAEGARVALPETIESSFLLGRGVMSELGISEREINRVQSAMRKDNYQNS